VGEASRPDHCSICPFKRRCLRPRSPQGELESLQRSTSGAAERTPEERATANIRRLERLERFQLVKRSSDGRLHVRADLLTQLEDRKRTHRRRPAARAHRAGWRQAVRLAASDPSSTSRSGNDSQNIITAELCVKENSCTFVEMNGIEPSAS